MIKDFDLVGRNARNIRGAIGEIIAWDTLRKMRIWTYKIGSWSFFPQGYPYWRGGLNNEHRFLTREQAEFVEDKIGNNISEFDFVGVKLKHGQHYFVEPSVEKVESVYLIEVKTGHPKTVKHYAKNPIRAFLPENVEKAKAVGFKVFLVIVELLDSWKCRISYREL